MTAALGLLADRGSDLLVRVIAVACSDRTLPEMAQEIAGLVVRSAESVTFCDVYVLDDEGRRLESGGPPVPLGTGDVGWVAAHGRPRPHADGRGLAIPVHRGNATIAVLDVRSARRVAPADVMLVEALGELFGPVLCSCRRLRTAQDREHAAERFAERAVEAQEAERTRLSRDIHDGIAQRLASVGFHLSAAEAALPEHHPDAREQLKLARHQCDLAGAETRAAIGGLRPPVLDDLGLPAALAGLARDTGASLDVTVTVTGELDAELPDHVQTALYRIAQEAVANALRHAAATCVDLLLDNERDRVRLRVADDGRGFSVQQPRALDSYGLRGMAERAELLGGRVSVTSRPGVGTTVEAVVPVPASRFAPPGT
ncbi:GAF domain-containing sensor histidine kinase [Actinomadura flavalba]|uniref:GAF domain-containing sensor histidine kinase n=1 Tax=Actinomadura flavalba TaxID=1120938 RepID=UPI00038110B8|nr:GAF domain-containing sensor histidine kinase [Actinomadura flavalba]